jgi:hypothetical protein
MAHNPIPAGAKALPLDPRTKAPRVLPSDAARPFAYTTVPGTATKATQTAAGMAKGKVVFRVHADCPKCSDDVNLTSRAEHGDHPVSCHCSPGYVFLVKW